MDISVFGLSAGARRRWVAATVVALACGFAARGTCWAGCPLLVVVDPGHGGSNTGAVGANPWLLEKRLTLQLAERLVALTESVDGLHVALTRDSDEDVPLRDRARAANALGADLFLSIHANAAAEGAHIAEDERTKVRGGFETYVLDVGDAEREARAAAARSASPLESALADLRATSSLNEAARFARHIQTRLSEVRPRCRSRGVRQASHDVLKGVLSPAVLVEVGFVDHPTEGPELFRPEVLDAIAGALAAAIVDERRVLCPERAPSTVAR
jgi:N-acetylmuramoyl-L-alanine amidase